MGKTAAAGVRGDEKSLPPPAPQPLALSRPGSTNVSAGGGGADALSIAWQYRKYMGESSSPLGGSSPASSSSSSSSSFVHSYDLSRPMQAEVLDAARPQVLDVGSFIDSGDGKQYQYVYDTIAKAVKDLPPRTVLRVVIKSLLDRKSGWAVTNKEWYAHTCIIVF